MRVEMRCTLAHQVRGPKQAIRSNRRGGGFRNETLVGIAIVVLSILVGSSETVAKPAQRKTCSLRDPHDVPALRHRMTESVHTSPGIKGRAISRSEHNSGGPDRGAHRT